MRTIVLDLETKKLFHEVDRGRHEKLGVSVLGLWDSSTGQERDSLKAFFEAELSQAWPILEVADLLVGFNIKKFDLPVLSAYYPGDLAKFPVFDLLDAVKEGLGFRLKLDDLAKATLGRGKTGTGLDAYRFFQQGKLAELKNYCLADVAITRDLYFHAVKHRHLKYFDLGNVLREIPIKIEQHLPKKSEQQMSLGV